MRFPDGRPNLHVGVVDTTVDLGAGSAWPGCPSPDPADNGALHASAGTPGCAAPTGAFLSDVADGSGGRLVNYPGALGDAVACLAQVGAGGCAFDEPLEAMKRALDGSQPGNAGFLRADADLLVVIVASEDDASLKDASSFALPDDAVGGHDDFRVHPLFALHCDQPISATAPGTYTSCTPPTDSYLQDPHAYTDFLAQLKGPGRAVEVAVIAGPPPGVQTNDSPPQVASDNAGANFIEVGAIVTGSGSDPLALLPSCHASTNGRTTVARPAVRLAAFAADFGALGRFYTICQSDYAFALADIAHTFAATLDVCVPAGSSLADVDPANPGLQLACTVADVATPGAPAQSETPIRACGMHDANTPDPHGARPCWWTRDDVAGCPAPGLGVEVVVERDTAAPAGSVVQVACAAVQSCQADAR